MNANEGQARNNPVRLRLEYGFLDVFQQQCHRARLPSCFLYRQKLSHLRFSVRVDIFEGRRLVEIARDFAPDVHLSTRLHQLKFRTALVHVVRGAWWVRWCDGAMVSVSNVVIGEWVGFRQ